ncbi:MAG: hypothetical protein IPG50_02360 [Myxococcales bacterium]|nr:hypothetical protein [Myxococcales bacterium]
MTRRTIAFLALASTAALGGHLLAACGEDDGGGGVDAGAADVSLDTSLPKADGSAGSDAGTPVDASKTDSAATTDGGQDATVVVDASLDAGADAALDAATDAPPCVPLVLLDGGGVVPTPYLQASDSPFRCVPFTSYYHLDNLEDGGIKKPGLTALSGVSTLSSFSGLDHRLRRRGRRDAERRRHDRLVPRLQLLVHRQQHSGHRVPVQRSHARRAAHACGPCLDRRLRQRHRDVLSLRRRRWRAGQLRDLGDR